ncbi:MAG: choice-of-anchor J domain-containing protein [Bacteroidales bacterium]|nr:choice-of-anchor J domain-containing protein [Bacteroidales bacterium]
MKKITFLLALLFSFAISTHAQLNEDFNNVADGSIPTGWTRFNVDGLTPNTNVSWVSNAWVCKQFGYIDSKALWSTSWYSSAGTSNDWVFTPSVQVPTVNPTLRYTILAQDSSYRDGYEVRIMTQAPTDTNLMSSTVLFSTSAAESTPTKKDIDLSAYAGQTVYIGWRNNSTDMYMLGLDDVKVFTLIPTLDLELTSLAIESIQTPSPFNIKGTVKNIENIAVTSFDVTYIIDEGTPSATYSLSGLNIAMDATYDFTHNVPATLTAGSHSIKVIISNVNGVGDTLTNNELTKQVVVASQSVAQKTLFEGFSSSTCSPCYSWNNQYNPWAASHENDMNYIKYQMNWPGNGDPYYVADGATRRDYYGVNAVPDMRANGEVINLSISELNANITPKNTPFKINVTEPKYTDNVVTIPISIDPYLTISGLKLHVAICEKLTTGNISTNGEIEFHHVLMGMAPNANGTTIDFVDGTTYTTTLTKDMTNTNVEEMNDLIAVIFIQDNANKKIYQSATFEIENSIGLSEVAQNEVSINVYPNPAKDNATIDITLSQNSVATIKVVDLMGRNVIELGTKSMKAGQNTIELNTSNLNNGMYFVKVASENGVVTKKITINR